MSISLSDYDVTIVDTCSLLCDEMSVEFFDEIIEKSSKVRILCTVERELKKKKEEGGDLGIKAGLMIDRIGEYKTSKHDKVTSLYMPGMGDGKHADPEIRAYVTANMSRESIIILTQDRDLAIDLVTVIERTRSSKRGKISAVAGIFQCGNLSEWQLSKCCKCPSETAIMELKGLKYNGKVLCKECLEKSRNTDTTKNQSHSPDPAAKNAYPYNRSSRNPAINDNNERLLEWGTKAALGLIAAFGYWWFNLRR